MDGEVPRGSQPKGQQRELPQQKNNLQRFLEKHGPQFETIKLPKSSDIPADLTLYVPRSELEGEEKKGNRDWYTSSAIEAARLNTGIFKTLAPQMNFLFVETTKQWNDYIGPGGPQKVKGDRHKGLGWPDVVAFTPPGIESETNADLSSQTSPDFMREILKHEAAHHAIISKYGQEAVRALPGWVAEGVPMAVNHPLEKGFSTPYRQRLKDFLASYDEPPPQEDLNKTYPGQEGKAPVMYSYGQQLLIWLIMRGNPTGDEIGVKGKLDDFLQNGIQGAVFEQERAMEKTFALTYKEAFVKFKEYLKGQ